MPERISTLQKITQSGIWNDGLVEDTVNTLMSKEASLTDKIWKPVALVTATTVLAACATPALTPQAQETPGTGQNSTEIAPASETDSTFKATFEWTASQAAINEVRSGIENSVSQLTPGFTLSPDAVSGYTIKVDRSALGLSELDVEFVTAREPVLNAMGIPSGDELTRDYMYTGNEGEPAEPLYRQIYDKNGQQWIRQYAYSPLGAEEVVQEYPIDAIERLQKGESVIMHFYPSADQNAAIGRTETKPIAVTVSPKPADNVIASAPTPFGNKEVSFVITATPVPATSTPLSTATAEATRTPEVSFNCPVNPNFESNMSQISFSRDIQTGNLARWIMSQTSASSPISKVVEKLDYTVSVVRSSNEMVFGAQRDDYTGWSTKHNNFVGVCKINPSEFGLTGKSDAFLVISINQDKNNRRVPVFSIVGKKEVLNAHNIGSLNNPTNQIQIVDLLNRNYDTSFIADGAQPGGPDDLRDLLTDNFYTNQNTTRDEVRSIFQSVAETDVFSDQAAEFLSKHVVFGTPGGWTYEKP